MFNCGTFEATHEAVAELCQAYEAPRVLDVGCGSGALLAALAPEIRFGVGIDRDERAVALAHRRAAGLDNLTFHALPVEQLPDRDLGHFDVILFVGSLEHMADPHIALRAACARAHWGSRIAVVAISPDAPHACLTRSALRWSAEPVVAHLGADGLRSVAGHAGLEVDDVRPLYRGSRRTRGTRAVGRMLKGYDSLGGPTCIVILRPASR
ncbi:class I SAM-dependent methyltransferase [Litchfieldella rifensis]|uniref:Class I SAM-dependent methyltransferase n=1 Tax=Litchfieldella rifensis TaxID=762643 RepID=A0ABV7LWA4_9GAMM